MRNFVIDSFLKKTNPWAYKIKDLNGEKIIGSFFEKELLLNKSWVIIQNQGVIRDKVKVVLDLSNYATEKELEHATGGDISDIAAKKILLLWKLKLTN